MRFASLAFVALSALFCTAQASTSAAQPTRKEFRIRGDSAATYQNSRSIAASSSLTRLSKPATVSDPVEAAKSALAAIAPGAEFRVNGDQHTDATTGLTHVYMTQTINGIDIRNAKANFNIKSDGSVFSFGNSFLPANTAAPPVTKRQQLIDPVDALKGAIATQGYPMKADNAKAIPVSSLVGNSQSYTFEGVEGVLSTPKAELSYFNTAEGLKLTWRLETNMGEYYMITYANAMAQGNVVGAVDYVAAATYKVFEFGVNDPEEGPGRVTVTDPWNLDASPDGWHTSGDTDYTTTQGNNVVAHENWDGDSSYTGDHQAEGGAELDFEFDYDPTDTNPHDYIDAGLTQLFYTINTYHDLLEELGFDEAAGNFEAANTKQGGKSGDAVNLRAQDAYSACPNNAFFSTPPDGQSGYMIVCLWTVTNPERDGEFDEGVIIHEYTHGLSNRLTGGAADSECLTTTEAGGMGEGWGDFYATAIRIRPNDTRETSYEIGDWANGGKGIRDYPYTTSLTKNPSTYSTMNSYTNVHDFGSVWAEILYEVLWNFEDKLGYDANPFPDAPVPTHGRQRWMKIVLEAMKLQPCEPTFLQARDAIVDASVALNGGEYLCEIWTAFAKRGLGSDATDNGEFVDGFKNPEC